MNGDMAMVIKRSRSCSSVRVAMIAGTLQPKPTISGTKDLPGRPTAAHEPVHDERGARHIAGVLQHRQKQEQEADHRDERGDHLNAAADAVGQQRSAIPATRSPRAALWANPSTTIARRHDIEEIDEGAADIDGEHEHQIHDGDKKIGMPSAGSAPPGRSCRKPLRVGPRPFAAHRASWINALADEAIAPIGHAADVDIVVQGRFDLQGGRVLRSWRVGRGHTSAHNLHRQRIPSRSRMASHRGSNPFASPAAMTPPWGFQDRRCARLPPRLS